MPLPESLQKLLNNPNIQKMQLMMNYPSVRRMQQIFDNYPKINEFRVKVYYSNLNIQIPIQIMDSQLQIIKNYSEVYSKNYNYWNNIINSAIGAYNSTQEEEFEVVIENIPVSIIKPTIKEIVTFYVEQGINIETAFRLAISSYIFIKIYPVIFMINSEELVIFLNQFSKYIYKCGSSVLKLSIQKYYEFQDPEEFAKFLVDQGTSALFGFIIGILK
ncbi:hypothetical protein HMPREF3180_01611 [Leptotrichia wadei]|jgi:hypothetical protein|uniref:Uncharacterized protein n=1 Tax=Leptotrichia wadei TaxID=157687 RepID=A0A134A6K9_9FUSO|nr:hypothetical protein [Leptotrichia wadei]KXB63351.1 hypothetical protein HMPREF3180_01611 [Leptotrichia wadei]